MLAGYRVLLVEDETLVAGDLSAMLAEAEGVPVGPATSVIERQPRHRSAHIPQHSARHGELS